MMGNIMWGFQMITRKVVCECKRVFVVNRVYINEPPRGKTNNVVSEQVRQKPTCTVTEKS